MSIIRFLLEPTDDPGLDCVVCRLANVDHIFAYRTNGGRGCQGIHSGCIERAESLVREKEIAAEKRAKK